MEHEFSFTDEFLEFAVKCSSQYDNTTRNMAREILELRKQVGELKGQMASVRREAQEDDWRPAPTPNQSQSSIR